MQGELPDKSHSPPIATEPHPATDIFDNSDLPPIDESAPEFSPLNNSRTSLPPIETIVNPPPSDEDEHRPDSERSASALPPNGSIAAYDFDNDSWNYDTIPPRRTFYQAYSSAAMVRTIRQIMALLLPLNALRFGQRQTHRPINRLSETIPRNQFHRLFREYQNYQDLTDSIGSVCEDQRKVPNRWIPHLQRVRRVRQLLQQYIDNAESLLKNHGYLDGLKEYVAEHQVEFWLAESPGGLLYTHELQYLYGLNCFLVDNDYPHLAKRTQ